MTSSNTIGFIGYGAMARLMAVHLRRAGHRIVAYTPSGKAPDDGTEMLTTPRAVAQASTAVLVSVPNDAALETSAYGEDGFLAGTAAGGLVIDLSSVSPDASRRLSQAGADAHIAVLDAPVSGSTPQAEAGALIVLVGGSAMDLDRARPFLEPFAKQIVHVGPSGHGSTIKLVINGIMVSTMAVIAEATGYGLAAGLDRDILVQTLSGLPVISPQHQHKLKTAAAGDLSPKFPTALAHKDLGLLLADAATHTAPLPTIAAATQLLSLTAQSHAKDDYSAVLPTAIGLAGVR